MKYAESPSPANHAMMPAITSTAPTVQMILVLSAFIGVYRRPNLLLFRAADDSSVAEFLRVCSREPRNPGLRKMLRESLRAATPKTASSPPPAKASAPPDFPRRTPPDKTPAADAAPAFDASDPDKNASRRSPGIPDSVSRSRSRRHGATATPPAGSSAAIFPAADAPPPASRTHRPARLPADSPGTGRDPRLPPPGPRSEEHTSELQSHSFISY